MSASVTQANESPPAKSAYGDCATRAGVVAVAAITSDACLASRLVQLGTTAAHVRLDGGNRRIYAAGLRNCTAQAIAPATGALWCVVNERDGLGDDLPPDHATSVRGGAYYGWPWYYIGDHEDPRLKGQRPDLAGHVTVPDVLIQPHSAPLGITFYDGAQFPPEYRGDAFVTLRGSWNRARNRLQGGEAALRQRQTDREYEDFLTGFAADQAVWARRSASRWRMMARCW